MKKNILFYILTFAFVSTIMAGCEKDPKHTSEQKDFIAKTVPGVYGSSSDQFVFSDATCQYAISVTAKSVRLQKDNMSQYIHVEFETQPTSIDKKYEAKIVSSGVRLSGSSSSYTLTLLKSEGGMMWLWHPGSKAGLLLPAIE